MSLIRNGGFERGNIQFWEVESGGTLEIDNTNQKYGNYCGKFTAAGTAGGVILSSDYVDVKPYQIVDGILYMKSATTRQAYLIMHLYDADYSLIDTQVGTYVANDGTYVEMQNQFIVPPGCAYIRFGVEINSSAAGEVFYFDGAGLEIIGVEGGFCGVVELLPFDAYTASGGTYYSSKTMQQYSTYFAELYCNYVSGTSPTLDVEVREINWIGQWVSLASFTTVTAAEDQRIDLPHCQGNQMYLIYTIGGTDPEFDFGVAVVGKG